MTYRSAIVGVGPRAYRHAEAYRHVTGGELVACCNKRNVAARTKFAEQFGLAAYPSVEAMIAAEEPDLVHVVTQPLVRVDIMTQLSDLGVPAVLVEKPIAYQVSDWRALVDLEASSATNFGVGAQVRYHENLARCQQAIASGELGTLRFIDCSARMTICNQGVHVLDWAMFLNGDVPPVRVYGQASGAVDLDSPNHPSPDTTTAQIDFANGVRALWNLGHTAPKVMDDDAIYKHCRIAAWCDTGHTLYEEFNRWEVVAGTDVQQGAVDPEAWSDLNDHAQARLTDAMFAWLDGGEPVGTNLARSLMQWNAILGLYASAVERRPIDLPFEPDLDLWTKLNDVLRG